MSSPSLPTAKTKRQALGRYGRVGNVIGELDDRLGVAKGGRVFLDKIFPDHWSFMLGEIALYSFVILMATGVFLSLYFVPSTTEVIYHGTYVPLRGQSVSSVPSWCTWPVSSSRGHSASRASSTGPSGPSC